MGGLAPLELMSRPKLRDYVAHLRAAVPGLTAGEDNDGEVGMRNRPSDWSTRVTHNILVYQYRLCYTLPLYCTGALSRLVI